VQLAHHCRVVSLAQGFLFTHRGYSGPSILDLSHHAVIDIERLHETADDAKRAKTTTTMTTVNWCDTPDHEWRELLLSALAKGGSATRLVSTMLSERMPHRLALALCAEADVTGQRLADLTKEKREQLIALLTQYRLPYTGTSPCCVVSCRVVSCRVVSCRVHRSMEEAI
jgi:predicted flavoprotein YhiN